MSNEYKNRVLDFRPAPTGWRLVFLDAATMDVEPMPGWLVLQEVEVQTDGTEVPTGWRDVEPGWFADGTVDPASNCLVPLWRVLAPGQDVPTQEEVAAERERLREQAEMMAAATRRQEVGQ
jgi:hypothetical protein